MKVTVMLIVITALGTIPKGSGKVAGRVVNPDQKIRSSDNKKQENRELCCPGGPLSENQRKSKEINTWTLPGN